jgi:hypothetical protein
VTRGVRARLCAAAAIAWACAGAPESERQSLAVVVAPVNFNQSLPAAIEPGIPLVYEEIVAFLGAKGARVVAAPPLAEFHDTWLSSAGHVKSLYDEKGEFDPARFDSAVAALVKAYVDRVGGFDAFVLSYIDVTQVRIKSRNVSWDGVVRRIDLRTQQLSRDHWIEGIGVPCTSLRVLTYGPDGARRFEARRGLEVVYAFETSNTADRFQPMMRKDLFQDRTVVTQAVEATLRRLFQERP